MVRPVSATRRRLPGGSFIWPYTIATFEFVRFFRSMTPDSDHLVIEVVAFAGALTDAGEHGQTRVLLGDVVDQLEHVDGLADAGAAEQADLAALRERHQQVDDLDAGDQQVLAAGLLVVRRRGAVNRQRTPSAATGPRSSCGVPSTSMMRPSVALPTGTVIGLPVASTSGRASGLRRRPWRSCARRRRRAAAALRA